VGVPQRVFEDIDLYSSPQKRHDKLDKITKNLTIYIVSGK
jgi:hypothetical protein